MKQPPYQSHLEQYGYSSGYLPDSPSVMALVEELEQLRSENAALRNKLDESTNKLQNLFSFIHAGV